jgi:hypothetical protein
MEINFDEEIKNLILEQIEEKTREILKSETKKLIEESIEDILSDKWDCHLEDLHENFEDKVIEKWEEFIKDRADYWDCWAKRWKSLLLECLRLLNSSFEKSIKNLTSFANNNLIQISNVNELKEKFEKFVEEEAPKYGLCKREEETNK